MTAILGTRAGTTPRAAVRAVEPLPAVLGPDLPGAACKGRAPLFDDWREHRTEKGTFRPETATERVERHARAIEICGVCPIRAACLEERLAQPALGAGIWAGQLFGHGPVTRQCRCGNLIPTNARVTQDYCSDPCRKAHDAAHRRAPQTRYVTCRCGVVFTTTHPQRLYCGQGCQRDAIRAYERARCARRGPRSKRRADLGVAS